MNKYLNLPYFKLKLNVLLINAAEKVVRNLLLFKKHGTKETLCDHKINVKNKQQCETYQNQIPRYTKILWNLSTTDTVPWGQRQVSVVEGRSVMGR